MPSKFPPRRLAIRGQRTTGLLPSEDDALDGRNAQIAAVHDGVANGRST